MKDIFRILYLLAVLVSFDDSLAFTKIEAKVQDLQGVPTTMNVLKRTISDEESFKKENDQKAVFDKDLGVSFLPSEAHIFEGNLSKLPPRKRKDMREIISTTHNSDQSKGTPKDPITGSKDDLNRPTSSKIIYKPRKNSSEYSRNRKTVQNRERLQFLAKNDPKKFVERRERSRIRKKKSVLKLRTDSTFQEQTKKHSRLHSEKLKRFRKNVREGIATEEQIKVVSRIRERERRHKQKNAKDE